MKPMKKPSAGIGRSRNKSISFKAAKRGAEDIVGGTISQDASLLVKSGGLGMGAGTMLTAAADLA